MGCTPGGTILQPEFSTLFAVEWTRSERKRMRSCKDFTDEMSAEV